MELLTPAELEAYADVLFWALCTSRGAPFKNGDAVLVRFDVPAVRLAEAVYARLIKAHLHPFCRVNPTPVMEAELLACGSFGQLVFQPPGRIEAMEQVQGMVCILAPASLSHLSAIDPSAVAAMRGAAAPLRRVEERRTRAGQLGLTTCVYPTNALAAAAGLELPEYARLLARACRLNTPDPVREWQDLRRETGEIALRLDGLCARALHVESASVDLRVRPGGNRRFVAVDGHNVPAGEIYLSPDWRGTSGVFFADQPTIRLGRVVSGARLEFFDGVAVRAAADSGEQFLLKQLYSDSGARRIGEFSLTDRRHTRVTRFMAHTLLDENLGGESGNCHIALGASLPESFSGPLQALSPELEAELGFNVSALHWDFVNTEPKRVTAELPDGRTVPVYEDGEFRL